MTEQGIEPEFRWTTAPDDVIALLPDMMRVHRERDLSLGRRPDHEDPVTAAFYREAITRFAAAGETGVLTLRLHGTLVAYLFGFRDNRTFRVWDGRMDSRWSEFGPGKLLDHELLQHVVTSPDYDALDWMRGEQIYKLHNGAQVVPVVNLSVWSSRTLRQADELTRDLALAARRQLKRWPTAEQRVKQAWHKVLDLRARRGSAVGAD
jgi:CelD/BcsL family acetyltransferase involved in cellulose biosynthesis